MGRKLSINRDLEKEVISYLNKKADKNFRLIENNLLLVRRILGEGFTTEDCFKVIDNRVGYWKGDPTWEQYLRPITLFNKNKFEGYLNAMPYKKPDRPQTKNEQSFDVLKEWGEDHKSREENDKGEFPNGDGSIQICRGDKS